MSSVESRMLGVLCVVRRLPGTVGCRALGHGMVRELEGVGFSRAGASRGECEEGMCFSRFEVCKLRVWYGTRSGRRAGFY